MHYLAEPRGDETRGTAVHRFPIRLVTLVCALGVVVTSVAVTSDEQVADAAIVSNPCDPGRITVIGADGRSSSSRPETVVQVYPTGDICEFEQRVLEMIATDRGTTLTDEIRGELLSYGRDEVRARLYTELFGLVQRAGSLTDPVEIGALDWFVARYAELREQIALNAQAEYQKWVLGQCAYEPPEGFEYSGLGACSGLTALYSGGPKPPKYGEFIEYGAAVTSEELLDGLGADASAKAILKAVAILGTYAGANVAAATIGALIAPVIKSVVFPFVKATVAVGGRVAGPAGIIISAVVTSIIRGIEVFEAKQIPIKLAEEVQKTSSIALRELIMATTTPGGTTELLLTVMNATSPDLATPDPVAVPPSEPEADTPLWVLPDGSLSPTFTFIDPDNGVNRAWLKDRWFVVQPIDPAGTIRLVPELSYRNSEGRETSARFVNDKLLIESIAEYGPAESPSCAPPRCVLSLEIRHLVLGDDGPEPATAVFSGSPPMIVSGPTVTGPDDVIDAGDLATFDADATDVETASSALEYTWEVSGEGFDAVTTYVGKTVQHRFAGSGQYAVTVTVTDEAGARTAASVGVEVPLPSTELTARTQRFFAGDWRNLALIQGQPGRLVATSSLADVCISIDWDGDGVIDESTYTAGNTVNFDAPLDKILPIGIVPVELVANLESCDGAEIHRATLSAEVLNSPPYDVVAELRHPDGVYRASPTAESAPTYEEGTSIPVRLRARDDGGPDALRFALFWRPGGPVQTHTQVLDASPPADGLNTVVETFITAVDQRTANSDFDLLVVAEDSLGQVSTEAAFSYFNIVNVAPEIVEIDTTSDNLGNVTLVTRVSDQGNAQLDVERISIDWGDGSDPEDVPIDNSIGNTYFFADVVGQGAHRYAAPGTYTVAVTAFDDETSVSEQIELTLDPFQPVIADITELDVGAVGSLTTIGFQVDDPDTPPEDLSVVVDWGDGSTSPAVYDPGTASFVATRTFVESATYAVTIEVNDGELDAVPLEGSVTVGDAPPTVVIDQAATQADPTSGDTVAFDVTFSEPVAGFDADDVALSGTAGATSVTVVNSGDDTAYRVDVTGMTQAGTIIAQVVESAATNDAGSSSLASTSTDNEVTFIPAIEITLPGVDGVLTVDNESGRAGAKVDFTVVATGGAAPPDITCEPSSGSFFPIGDTTVGCTVVDGGPDVDGFAGAVTASLTATADFVVRVVDVDAPTITIDPAIGSGVAEESSDGEPVAVTFPIPTGTDNSGSATTICTPAPGTLFPVGSTTVTCTVSDPAGNSETTSFVVTVTDQTSTSTTPTTTGTTTVSATPNPNPNGGGVPGGSVVELPATGTGPQTVVLLALALLLLGSLLMLSRRAQRS